MIAIVEKIEHLVVVVLLIMMIAVILCGTAWMGWETVRQLLTPPLFLLDTSKMMELFGLFFMILIGLELLETVKTYLSGNQLHVEVIFLVAMIAVARKVIILDMKHLDPGVPLGIAVLIICLAGGYFLVRRASSSAKPEHVQKKNNAG
ncbi:MAG TPA: phosphate-starvation-inducible PsiE family protein [bacterium]|nr:phosphate-starvation-inducible PsiE family protein [bacterium]HPQ65855.1 phosphate-starvation-inducible PsiE family protein [bacterium]